MDFKVFGKESGKTLMLIPGLGVSYEIFLPLIELLEDRFCIESAATSSEEIWNGIGNPVYPPAKRKLAENGLSCEGKRARQITKQDYYKYDLIIGMDQANLRNINRITGRDDKTHLLMEYAGKNLDVADPWYTGDFDTAWDDILEGCKALFKYLTK